MMKITSYITAIAFVFEEASYLFTTCCSVRKSYKVIRHEKLATEAYLFMMGTGLEMMIENLGLDYNAESLRSNFFNVMKRKNESRNQCNNLSSQG